ncbi:hypothetical protein ACHAWO_003247 [Cyclotella atomus]|uniref:Uncharacterized protein n=1 Tax=Cyclotella atomus TaxID=382360 RepID=A0ABD3Q809_9STRA
MLNDILAPVNDHLKVFLRIQPSQRRSESVLGTYHSNQHHFATNEYKFLVGKEPDSFSLS